MKKLLTCEYADGWANAAPFTLRLVLGFGMLAHGWQKLTVMGVDAFGGMLAELGIPFAGFSAGLVTWVEILAGLALILGIYTRLSAKLLGIIMLIAIFTAHIGNGFFVNNPGMGGVELPLVYLAGFVSLMITGPGKWGVGSSAGAK